MRAVTAIRLGRPSLTGSVLPTRRLVRDHTSSRGLAPAATPAYLVLLRVEIARFTRRQRLRVAADSSLLL